MILRKPYAFLIKYFKPIHLVLAVLLGYLIFKTTGIITFFNNYAKNGTFEYVNNLAGKYVNVFMYLAIILVLVAMIFIFYLMRNKKKPVKFYTIAIIYYIILFIMMSVCYGILQDLQFEIASSQTLRAYRDISLLIYIPQFFFLIFSIVRGIGLDLKRLNFGQDLLELEIEEKDNEEVEVVVGENFKIKRTLRRLLREFQYYFKENTFIVISILAIVAVILVTMLFFSRGVYQRTYRVNQTFSYQGLKLKNVNSVITKNDFGGKEITKGKYYLVVNFNIQNSTIYKKIEMSDFRLIAGSKIYYPDKYNGEYFVDLGVPYIEQGLDKGTNQDYIFVYEIDEKDVKKQYKMRIVEDIKYNIGEIIPNYRYVLIKPTIIDKPQVVGNYNLQETVTVDDKILNKSTFRFDNYTFSNSYRYKYDFCYEGECVESYGSISPSGSSSSGTTIMAIDYTMDLKDTYLTLKNKTDVFNYFLKIRYVDEYGNTKTTGIVNKTPPSVKNQLFLQVNNEISKAREIEFLFTVRNDQYIIKAK